MKIKEFINKILFQNLKNDWIDINIVSKKEAETIEKNTGLNVLGYTRIIDDSGVKHVFKNHSNPITEANRGQIAVTVDDFELIPKIVKHYDSIEKSINDSNKEVIKYTKVINHKYFYVEEIRKGRKKLALNTFYIKKAPK